MNVQGYKKKYNKDFKSHHLLLLMPIETRVKLCCPHNISGASQHPLKKLGTSLEH